MLQESAGPSCSTYCRWVVGATCTNNRLKILAVVVVSPCCERTWSQQQNHGPAGRHPVRSQAGRDAPSRYVARETTRGASMWRFDQEHMAELPLLLQPAALRLLEKERRNTESSPREKTERMQRNEETKSRRRGKMGRRVIKGGRRHVETAAFLQRHTVSASCLSYSFFCLSFPPSLFTTGVIDQLVYWWLQEVEAVVLVEYITAVWFYGSLIAPHWWSTKDAPKKVWDSRKPSLSSFLFALSFKFTWQFSKTQQIPLSSFPSSSSKPCPDIGAKLNSFFIPHASWPQAISASSQSSSYVITSLLQMKSSKRFPNFSLHWGHTVGYSLSQERTWCWRDFTC